MRAVLDVNVLISALLSASGPPARTLRAWRMGAFDLIVSPLLLAELRRALNYPKLSRFISAEEAAMFIELLERSAVAVKDPGTTPSFRSLDPADDYLLALAEAERAVLVTGDGHLLELRESGPIVSPAEFVASLANEMGEG